MSGERLNVAKAAAEELVATVLDVDDYVGLIGFAGSVTIVQPLAKLGTRNCHLWRVGVGTALANHDFAVTCIAMPLFCMRIHGGCNTLCALVLAACWSCWEGDSMSCRRLMPTCPVCPYFGTLRRHNQTLVVAVAQDRSTSGMRLRR